MMLLLLITLTLAIITRPAISILEERQTPQSAMNAPSLNDNTACLLLGTALYICETLTPSFTGLAATLQAPCLCYSSTSWVPSIFDTAVERCAGFAQSAAPFAFGDVDGLRGFCGGLGDVLASPNNIVASTTRTSVTTLDNTQSTTHTTQTLIFTPALSTTTSFIEPSIASLSSASVLSSESTQLSTMSESVPPDSFSSLIEDSPTTSTISSTTSSSILESISSTISSPFLESSSETSQSSTSISTPHEITTVSTPENSEQMILSITSMMTETTSSDAEAPPSTQEASQRDFILTEYDFLLISFMIAMLLTFLMVLVGITAKWILSMTAVSLTTRPRRNNEKTLLGDVDFEDTEIDTANMI